MLLRIGPRSRSASHPIAESLPKPQPAPSSRAEYLKMERSWLRLAGSYWFFGTSEAVRG
jgi:hypothetical protein